MLSLLCHILLYPYPKVLAEAILFYCTGVIYGTCTHPYPCIVVDSFYTAYELNYDIEATKRCHQV